jgi:hypothetical protein
VALKVTLLEGELVDVRQACDLAMVKLQGLSDMAADADRRWEDVKGQCKILAQKLTLLQTKVSELCQAIVGPQRPPHLRRCKLLPPIIPRWPGKLAGFTRRCLLLCNPCSSTRLLKHSRWMLWGRWLLSSRSRRSGACASRTPVQRYVTKCLSCLPTGSDWPTSWRRLSGDFGWCKQSVKRWALSWGACEALGALPIRPPYQRRRLRVQS